MTQQESARGEQGSEWRWGAFFHVFVLPAVGSTVAVAVATRRWDWSALATGLAITASLYLFWQLHCALLQPPLERLRHDWLRLGLQMTLSVLGHVVGAGLALFLCSRAFGYRVEATAAWVFLGGIVLAFPIVHGTETALDYYRRLQEKERAAQELQTLAAQADLKALKAQINPHFLFNTLNTIAALIHTDPTLAEVTVERLAEMFRYVLVGSERGLTSLEEELAFVDGYLAIERARFGQRLHVARQVAPEALAVSVPSLILQPLVENAVRHGRREDGVVDLTLRVQLTAGEVVITVADRGPGMPENHSVEHGPGHGLRNVDQRLRAMYGRGVEIGQNEPHGAVVTVRVPVISTPDSTPDTPPLPNTDTHEETPCAS